MPGAPPVPRDGAGADDPPEPAPGVRPGAGTLGGGPFGSRGGPGGRSGGRGFPGAGTPGFGPGAPGAGLGAPGAPGMPFVWAIAGASVSVDATNTKIHEVRFNIFMT